MFKHRESSITRESDMLKNKTALNSRLAILVLLAAACASLSPVRAQDYLTQIGVPAFTTAQPVEAGFIDLANGNLHLTIPLGTFPQRGSRPLVAALVYDSRIWSIQQSTNNFWTPLLNVPNAWAGWRFVLTSGTGKYSVSSYLDYC